MSVVYPSPSRLEALSRRWDGEESRLRRIADAMLAGEDWTRHLGGLPFVDEIQAMPGEMYGRDLRGAPLRRLLRPNVRIHEAQECQAAHIASITLEADRHTIPVPGATCFPSEAHSAESMGVALRRGAVFLLASVGTEFVGVIRLEQRQEFSEFTADRPYMEVSGLGVLPSHRKLGIGGALLEAAHEHARARGFEYVLLRTTVEVGLVPWYESKGYSVQRIRQLSFKDAPVYLDAIMAQQLPKPASTPGRARPRFVRSPS